MADLPQMWRDILRLSKVGAGDAVTVLGLPETGRYKAMAMEAATALGAEAAYVELTEQNKLSVAAKAALAASDLVVDLAFSHAPDIQALRGQGVRFLAVLEPPEILARMFPTEATRARVKAAQERLKAGRSMRVTSAAGTDFRCDLGEFRTNCQYGFADEAGRWDQWPGAFVSCYANEGSAEGTIVLDAGDILFPQKFYLQSPVRLTIEGGFIRAIDGGLDARHLRDILAGYRHPDVYAVSHLGWGLDHTARWAELTRWDRAATEGQDGRAYYGNFLFSTGPNLSGGGTRWAPCHLDLPMRGCSVHVDNEAMVLDGNVVAEGQRVAGFTPAG